MSIGAATICTAEIQGELIGSFHALYEGPPAWAWPYPPSIPFIGNQFEPGRGIFIYASAENLSWMTSGQIPERFQTEAAWNRYRAVYEAEGRVSDSFFPDLGIAPVSNGGLLIAGLFVALRLGLQTMNSPRDFIETIAFSNWAKFSIRQQTNKDYIADIGKLTCSLPFVIAELCRLRPAVTLIPKAVWSHPILRAALRGAYPYTRFIPIPQFNAQVVNCHLARYETAAKMLRESVETATFSTWVGRISNLNKEHAWRYLVYLDIMLESTEREKEHG